MNPKTKHQSSQHDSPQALEPPRTVTLNSLALGLLLSAMTAWGQPEPPILGPDYPKDQTNSLGINVTTEVRVTGGTPPFGFQWFQNDVALLNATNLTLIFTNLLSNHAGAYYAVVTNASPLSVTSRVATLTVDPTFVHVLGARLGDDGFLRRSDLPWKQWDFDGDGWLEIVTSQGADTALFNEVYENNRDGTFSRITNRLTTVRGQWWSQAWADYDADGDLDCIIGESTMPPTLFLNQASEGIADFTSARQPWRVGLGGARADYDLDGWIDFSNAPWSGWTYLAHNEGGSFRMVTNSGFELNGMYTEFSDWVDYDGDGDPDCFGVTSPFEPEARPDFLLRNDGNGQFVRVTNHPLVNEPTTANIMAGWGDYDNDGDLDVVLPYLQIHNSVLYRNQGGGAFEQDPRFPALTRSQMPMNPSWGDYDNDGDLDLFVTHDSGVCRMFNNDGTGQLTETWVGGPTKEFRTYYGSWADYDNDGFLDLLAMRVDTARASALYRNNLPQVGNQNHWLKVQLRGIVSNPNGLHANIRVKATIRGNTVWQMRTIGVSHYATDLLAHFGLGDATRIETLRIEWPSGIVQELSNIPADQFMTVTEARNQPPPAPVVTHYGQAADGTFNATVTCAEPGVRAVLQASSDLVHWAKVMMRTNVTGTFEFTDTGAASRPNRFYRVVVP